MSSRVLIVRADTSVVIGTGHVMRCLALAQAWQDAGGDAVFAIAQPAPAIEERLRSERMQVVHMASAPGSTHDAAEVIRLAAEKHAAWVVVDGYQFDASYQHSLKDVELKLLFVDDTGECEHYSADLVLNQNIHAREEMYRRREPHTRLLLGPRHAMLRREFNSWHEWRREIPTIGRKVLVTMGGSDPGDVTSAVIRALQQVRVEGVEATVVAGGSNPNLESLQQVAREFPGTLRLLQNAGNMPELMAWADVAVAAAGTTCWEMCLLGLPALLIDVAPNQRPVAEELQRRQVAIHLGCSRDVTPERIAVEVESLLRSRELRAAMSQRAQELVDGRGAHRVLSALRGADLNLRLAEEKDCRLLWEWANDPAVRANSFSSEVIPWERHQQWFHSKLADPNLLLYLATNGDNHPVGQVRYDIQGNKAVLSISLAGAYRGAGHGHAVLNIATEELFRNTTVSMIDAYVKPDNEASLRLFTHAGFRRRGTETVQGHAAIHFQLKKPES